MCMGVLNQWKHHIHYKAMIRQQRLYLYSDVIMSMMASRIISLTIVYSIVYSGADQRKHKSFASLAFVRGIHRWPANSPHKGLVTRKMFPFDDVIMCSNRVLMWAQRGSVGFIFVTHSCIYITMYYIFNTGSLYFASMQTKNIVYLQAYMHAVLRFLRRRWSDHCGCWTKVPIIGTRYYCQ